jgi:uncharacterized protein
MSEQWVIDPLAFADKHASTNGDLPISQLTRLAAELASDSGAVSVTVRGAADEAGRPMLELTLNGRLSLTCQRCLEPMQFALSRVARFRLVKSQAELPDIESEDPEVDCIVADKRTDLRPLIEDEILLCLPISAMHEEADCAAAAGGQPATRSAGAPGAEAPPG